MTKKDNDIVLNTAPVDAELNEKLEKQQQEESEVEEFIEFKTHSRRDERFVAFNLIYAADRFDYTLTLQKLIEEFQEGFGLHLVKDSFAYKLAESTIDERDQLDEGLTPYLKNWKLDRLGCCTRLILRMALWEMQQPNAIPSIIINEAVELAKMFAERDAYKFVNGILDEFCKTHGMQEKNEDDKPHD
jgi:transcription antitermination protein NusB